MLKHLLTTNITTRVYLSCLQQRKDLLRKIFYSGNAFNSDIMAHVKQGDEHDDYYVPTSTWPTEAIQLYEKIKAETEEDGQFSGWEKYSRASQGGLDTRHFVRAAG